MIGRKFPTGNRVNFEGPAEAVFRAFGQGIRFFFLRKFAV